MEYIEFIGEKDYLHIDWTVSNVCNYDCSYCATGSKDGSFSWPDIEQVRITIKKLVAINPGKKISYSLMGGEMTLWKDFIKFVEMIREESGDCNVKLITNGIMPAKYWAQNGKLFDKIQFSYHPIPEKSNIDKFIESINASTSPINTVFVMTPPELFSYCVDSYNRIVAECPDLKMIIAKVIDNRASTLVSQLKPYTVEQSTWIKNSLIVKNIEHLTLPKFIGISVDGSKHNIEPQLLISTGNNKWKDWQCYVGVEKKTFRANGDITRGSSCNVGEIMGNWRTGELVDNDSSPVTCPYAACFCGADIMVSRKKY